MVDFFLLIQLAGTGDELQGIKRGIMEMADGIVINKADGNNIEKAKGYARFVVKECGAIPIAPHIYFTQFLDDTLPEDRAFGTMAGLMLLSDCDELWYFGDSVSQGMVREIIAAKEQEIPVRYISQKDINKMTKENGGKNDEN